MQIDSPKPVRKSADSILEHFTQVVEEAPFNTAVAYENTTISYRQLEIKADNLALHLMSKGIGKGDIVAVLLDSGIDLIISLLGILKSGAAYVPLSVDHPPGRTAQIIGTAESRLLLSSVQHHDLCENLSVEKLFIEKVDLVTIKKEKLRKKISGEDLAYVLFTSGSTGIPKGVRVLHKNLSYYTAWTTGFFQKTLQNNLPLTSESHFAAAVSQIYSCLCSGAVLHIVRKCLNDPEKLMGWYRENPESGLYCVPSVWNLVLEWLEKRDHSYAPPKGLFLSGEEIPQQLIARTWSMFPGLDIWNLYGPTEAVANLSFKKISSPTQITIGSPLKKTSFYVITENGREAAIGEKGLLYASGPGICAGYLNDDEQTKASFFPYASEKDGNIYVYNTGDYVERIGNNEYKFAGRKDQQVKINGQRIELTEIENIISAHPQVVTCIVLLPQMDNSGITAYIKAKTPVAVSALRDFAAKYLSSVMLPVYWIFLDEFPSMANGKINRKQLPLPDRRNAGDQKDYLQPATEEERKLASLFERTLKRKEVGAHENFFHLGGNSLKAVSLLIEIEETFFKKLSFPDLFNNPTVSALIPLISQATEVRQKSDIPAVDSPARFSLTHNQKALWFLQKANKENASYNIAYRINIEGKIDLNRLEYAINKVINSNDLFRSTIVYREEELYFTVKRKNIRIEVVSLEDSGISDRDAFISSAIEARASVPCSLTDENLFSFSIYTLSKNSCVLGFIVNHLIFDGESIPVFINQLMHYYSSYGKDRPDIGSFADIAAERSDYQRTGKFAQSTAFWESYLNGIRAMNTFPQIYRFPVKHPFEGGKATITVDSSFREKLENLRKEKDITLPMLLMAAFANTLYRFNPQNEYLIATPFANRLTRKELTTIGYLSNTLFLNVKFDTRMLFSELVSGIKSDIIHILDHQQTPLEILIGILRKQGVQIPLSAFKILFAYHDTSLNAASGEDIKMQAVEIGNIQSKCDLYMECFDDAETLRIQLTYDKSIMNASLALHFVQILKQILADSAEDFDQPVASLPAAWPHEKGLLQRYSTGEKKSFAADLTLYHLFEKAFTKYSALPAIIYYDQVIHYDELFEKTAQYISCLQLTGFEEQEPVGIYMDHSPEMIAAMLAAAASRIPYIPLDPAYPDDRIEYILAHAGVKKILTVSQKKINFSPERYNILYVDLLPPDIPAARPFESGVQASDTLYIIYTSGSTGNPKGVIVPNGGVANYLLWMQDTFSINPATKILAKTSISFDISVWELFLPLISGGTVVLKHKNHLESPEQLAIAINENQINTIQFVPSGLKLFADADMLLAVPSLTRIFCGGEKMTAKLKDEVLEQFDGELHNLYGPTEASIFMCHYPCRLSGHEVNVPIGRPVYNSELYVLDEDKKFLPRCIAGDLYIGGEILAAGYWRNKVQTEKSFLEVRLNGATTKIYKTGDRGRMLMDGSFEFLERQDTQIKIRGYRVEAGEIEATLLRYPGVKQAIAFKDTIDENDERLVALVITEEFIDLDDIRHFLRSKLPQFMIPSVIKRVSEIPKLPNGKTDMENLHSLTKASLPVQENPPFLQENNIESKLYTIWTEVIGHNNFSASDNFFDAGGHSILFLKIKEKIKEIMAVDFSIVELYQYPNIKSLAEQYRKKFQNVSSSRLQSIRNRTKLKKKQYGK